MEILNDLIQQARAASEIEPNWVMRGGRACPIGWHDCSQPVYQDIGSGAYDHGETGGPAATECEETCRHRMQPPDDDDMMLN